MSSIGSGFQGPGFFCALSRKLSVRFAGLDKSKQLRVAVSFAPRLVVVAMAQLKRDHPELALTAIDEVMPY